MDDAGLVDARREDGVDRLGEAGEAVGADEEHVPDAAVSELGQHARPEAGALGLLGPKAEAITFALEGDADRDVDGLLAHDLLVADRHLHRVQVDVRVPSRGTCGFAGEPEFRHPTRRRRGFAAAAHAATGRARLEIEVEPW